MQSLSTALSNWLVSAMYDNRPIGVFDSGLGGLTSINELSARLPHEDIVYFGDTGRIPYGTRSLETIIKYVRQDANFICSFNVKLILVACNTASYAALDVLKNELDIPVYGVIEDASKKAVQLSKNKNIAVMATPATISGHAFGKTLRTLDPELNVYEQACPLFVPLVENGRFDADDPIVKLVAEEYCAPVRGIGADTLIMGCTHYPLLREAISRCLPGVALVNSGAEAVNTVVSSIERDHMQADPARHGTRRYFVSDSVESFKKNAGMYLTNGIDGEVDWVDIEKY